MRPIAENYGARGGTIRDPFGHRWFVQTQIEIDDLPVEDAPGRRFGDIGYMTLNVPDAVEVRRVDLAVEMQVLSFNSSRNDASTLSAAPRLGRSRGPRVTPGSLASSAQSALGTPVSSSASSSFTQNGSVITP